MIYFILGTYLTALGIASLFVKESVLTRLLRVFLAFAPLWFLCSFKSINVGTDTAGYYQMFIESKSYAIGKQYPNMEIGFSIYAEVLSRTGMPFPVYLLIGYAFLYVPLMIMNFKFIRHVELSALCVLFYQFLNFHISGLRQTIAIGICLAGVLFLFAKKIPAAVRFLALILFVLVAYFFHRSALVSLILAPIFFLRKRRLPSPLIYLPVCLLAACLSPALYSAIFKFTQDFLYYDAPSTHFVLDLGFSTLIAIVVLAFCNIIYVRDVDMLFSSEHKLPVRAPNDHFASLAGGVDDGLRDEFFRFAFWIILLEVFTVCLFSSTRVFTRIIFYFISFFGPVVSMSLERIKNKRVFIPAYIVTAGLFAVYFYFATVRPGYLHIVPYEFYRF